ncbi:RNA-binding protein 43-like [Rhinoraja longicauda]
MESDWAERTIVVFGFPVDTFANIVMIDKLTIHFLRPRNGGGEVDSVIYPTDITGAAYVTFEKKEAVDSVLRHDQHLFEDKQLKKKYPLKVSQNHMDVFLTTSVELDSLTFEKSPELNNFLWEIISKSKILQVVTSRDGRRCVTGSFPALKELRKELHKKIAEFQGINFQDSTWKSGVSGFEENRVKSLSNNATGLTEPEKFTAPPSYGDEVALNPGVLRDECTIMLDADIFTYIDKIGKKQYEGILRNNYVTAKPQNYNNIIFLQLFETGESRKQSQLIMAKQELELFISQMQKSLVIEKMRLDGDGRINKPLMIREKIMQHFPKVFVRFADDCVTLIGNQDDCKEFMRKVEEAVRTEFDPASRKCHGSLNPTKNMQQFAQRTGSDTSYTLQMPRPVESNCEYMKGQVNSSSLYSWNDSHGKQGSSYYGVGSLDKGTSPLPPLPSVSLNTTEERQSRIDSRSDRPPNAMHY